MQEATIVFDLDGTLIDNAPDLIIATNHIMAHKSLPSVPPEIARTWISNGARHMIMQALDHAGKEVSEPELDALLDRFLAHYSANIAHQSRPFPGCLDLLNRLRDNGARLAICTNKREGLAKHLLDELALTPLFAAIVGRDTLPVCKPDPGHILGTVKLARGNPERAIMIGDSSNDIKAAIAANVPSIAVTFGYSSTPPARLGANALVSHYDDMEPHIISLLSCSAGTR